MSRAVVTLTFALAVLVPLGSAEAGSHLWQINELFSNADGTIQFIEMRECCGASNEIFIANKWVDSITTGSQYVFTANLPQGSTANAHLLLATAAFAALPGAPTPDHIIPDNFFDLNADTVRYWTYANSPLSFGPGELPLDGVMSWNRDNGAAVNSPTNFAGEAGTVDASPMPGSGDFIRGDADGNGDANALVDAIFMLQFGFVMGPAPQCDDSADANDDGGINPLTDALAILNTGFIPGTPPLPAPAVCGPDPTDDPLDCASSGCP